MTAHFTIPGEPKGKARPRFSSRSGRAYTPKDTVAYENKVKQCYSEQCGDYYFGTDIVSVKILAYYPIPKSASKKFRISVLNGLIRPGKKPDSDNVIKIVCDALNGVAWNDDAQVVECLFQKWYDEEPCVDVWVETII